MATIKTRDAFARPGRSKRRAYLFRIPSPRPVGRTAWATCLVTIAFVSTIEACSVYDQNPFDNKIDGDVRAVKSRDGGFFLRGDVVDSNTTTSDSGIRSDADNADADAISSGVEICGDGKVTGTELCDVNIMAGKLGACPTVCSSSNQCIDAHLSGSGCQTKCVHNYSGCKGGDNCCPSSCNVSNDSDCSSSCGDGIVQTEAGETCEPASAAGDASGLAPALICLTKCPDDGDPCTKETRSGSAANCNVRCTRTEIATFINGDKCCPPNANSKLDKDCPPRCGNGVIEAGEPCDGSADCDSECKLKSTEGYRRCIAEISGVDAACGECICSSCANEVEACFESGDSKPDADCAAIVNCGLGNDCTGAACYCGSVTVFGTCLTLQATGVCKEQVEHAAGTTDMITIFNQQIDLATAIGRSTALSDCHILQCNGCK